ncbi:MAG: NAD(P)H-dependent dehydrogenase/reductase [Phycisphaerae bacterium]|nr:NAD(P)H-dependent dehydrogenase/reductase [Phycisphaerae bacterium]
MIDLLRKRRSVRKFESRSIEPDKIEVLKEALLRSPTSRSLIPWEFVLVDDLALLKQLSRSKKHGSGFLKGAPLGIVVCADPAKCDVWIEDCAIASILVQMTALSLGLGSCWIQIRLRQFDTKTTSEEYIRKTLSLPSHLTILSMIAIGYPAEFPEPVLLSELPTGKIHSNGW